MNRLKIIFAGTPDFAATHLKSLLNFHDVVAVYTQPDRPAGRGKKIQQSPVKDLALKNNIPVLQPINFKDSSDQNELQKFNADIMIVVAYGVILPQIILDTPKLGCINVHGSILPRWRGAAPIQRALWAGDEKTGITIMKMELGLDSGPILAIKEIFITEEDTSKSLYDKLAVLGSNCLIDTLKNIQNILPIKQDPNLVTIAKKIKKEEALLDFNKTAKELVQEIKAFFPWPISYFRFNGENIKVIAAKKVNIPTKSADYGEILNINKNGIDIATQEGAIRFLILQFPGKKALPIADILNSKAELLKKGVKLNK